MGFQSLLKRLAEAFQARDIPYMVIGGQAVLLYGDPRLTKDIDLTVGLTPDKSAPVLDIIKDLRLGLLVENAQEFLTQTFVLPVQDPDEYVLT